jgi:hypothetical protein
MCITRGLAKVLARIQGDAWSVGAVLCLIMGIVIFGPAVHELRILRVTLRGSKALGWVELVRETRTDRYGDAVKWSSTVAYWAELGGKRHQIRFEERLGYAQTRKQEVAVRYDPRRPERFATIRTPREVFAKAAGLTVMGAIFIAVFFGWLYGSH